MNLYKLMQNENVLMIIYFAYSPQVKFINWYRRIYCKFNIIFYAEDNGKINKKNYDSEINWIKLSIKYNYEKNNDWFMHKCLLDCIPKYKYDGYIFMADDVLFRYWKFDDFPIDKFCITQVQMANSLDYILKNPNKCFSIGREPISSIQKFFNNSSENYKNNIKSHFNNETTFVQLSNNDFVYIPGKFAEEWYNNCFEMNKYDLNFVTCIFNSVFGSCKPSDIIYISGGYIRNDYINENDHINHPVKFSKEKNRKLFENEIENIK